MNIHDYRKENFGMNDFMHHLKGLVAQVGYDVNSMCHSMTLVGPDNGKWALKKIIVDFECENTPPYSVEFAAVELDESTEVDIWKDPPLVTFDV